jgi:hypothetical protein
VAPGVLSLSAGAIDFGRTVDNAAIRLTNTGGGPVDWSTTTGPAGFVAPAHPFSAVPTSGNLAPGAWVDVVVTIDRTWPTEGPVATTRLRFVATGTTAAVDLNGIIARAPTLRVSTPGPTHCPQDPIVATATVIDESALTVEWQIASPTGSASIPMTLARTVWRASTAPDLDGNKVPDSGLYTWSIVATDAFGNRTARSGNTDVQTVYCR